MILEEVVAWRGGKTNQKRMDVEPFTKLQKRQIELEIMKLILKYILIIIPFISFSQENLSLEDIKIGLNKILKFN